MNFLRTTVSERLAANALLIAWLLACAAMVLWQNL